MPCKGGNNQADHAHLDLGSFVLDMNGVRWASELGRDNYDLPGYFDLSEGGGRWKYFRLNTHSHNTLVFNNDNQRATAKSEIVNMQISANESIWSSGSHQKLMFLMQNQFIRTIKLIKNDEIMMKDKIHGRDLKNWSNGKCLQMLIVSSVRPKG